MAHRQFGFTQRIYDPQTTGLSRSESGERGKAKQHMAKVRGWYVLCKYVSYDDGIRYHTGAAAVCTVGKFFRRKEGKEGWWRTEKNG